MLAGVVVGEVLAQVALGSGSGKIFNDLAEGGKIKGQLSKRSGGGEVGWLVDKFGMNWMVSIDRA